ncbi:heterokaryon incompatibility protein-domain-containing protein [Lophiotrema nucula]|uniref:Heterokaryon incompatibility protein-domain-containing protein n=1 Tax=Lophiotrema nucula TaxID=690887 RepID=A0A6A5ZGN2_9PLEO|nr:heterokaryon incompatibility protein-domain-containing protein [Lophiotrema nucula]
MIDDLNNPKQLQGIFGLRQYVDSILEHRSNRAHAEKWAKNLRFLTFDDGQGKTDPERASEDLNLTGQCLPCEQNLPLAYPPHVGTSDRNPRRDKAKVQQWLSESQQYPNPCVHIKSLASHCFDCCHPRFPLFPNSGTVSKFRIRRLRPRGAHWQELSNCCHFVAVSYCWSSTDGESEVDKYTVTEEDGTERPCRTPRSIIDRAVEFARHNGVRMIWIDQECIQQDDPNEKEQAVQGMDLVYSRAIFTIGLFSSRLRQADIDILSSRLVEPVTKHSRRADRSHHRAQKALDCFRNIVLDRWNTRAWILQEAFASRGNMILLFPIAENLDLEGCTFIRQDLSRTEVATTLRHIGYLLKARLQIYRPKNEIEDMGVYDWAEVEQRAQWFSPHMGVPSLWTFYFNDEEARISCNAAVALSFLQGRYNTIAADRLAICANLCDWDFRLDTYSIERTNLPLSACFIVLAMMNGDHSLLVPELCPTLAPVSDGPHGVRGTEFSWTPSNTNALMTSHLSTSNPKGMVYGITNANIYHMCSAGFRTEGVLWKIDRFINLIDLQTKHAASWSRVQQNVKASRQAKKRLLTATTHILYSILSTLRHQSLFEEADAIWQSISGLHLTKETDHPTVPEYFTDVPEVFRLENRRRLFDLALSASGVPYHIWLVDIVMQQGGLWVGRRTTSPFDNDAEPYIGQVSSKELFDPLLSDPLSPNFTERMNLTMVERLLALSSKANPDRGNVTDSGLAQIVQSSYAFAIVQHPEVDNIGGVPRPVLNRALISSPKDAQGNDKYSSGKKFRSYEEQPPLGTSQTVGLERKILDLHGAGKQWQRGIFNVKGNVDGSVFVLTPWFDRLETIPRPELRSMSVSWVVRPVDTEETLCSHGHHNTGLMGSFRTEGMVQGMWKYQTMAPMCKYRLL